MRTGRMCSFSVRLRTLKILGRPIIKGRASGRALVLKEPFAFAHGINPQTGAICDRRLSLFGQKLQGRVFVFPYGRGSTTGSTWILELARREKLPIAMVNLETEPIFASGLILSQAFYGVTVPTIDRLHRNPFEFIKAGDIVEVNSELGFVRLLDSARGADLGSGRRR